MPSMLAAASRPGTRLRLPLTPGRKDQRRVPQTEAHNVKITHAGTTYDLEVPDGTTILEVCQENNIEVPYDCAMGVCMVCPAKLTSGTVDQGTGMLPDDVQEQGYMLMCTSTPLEDCTIETVEEDEVLEGVMQG